jgi:hypothetical protein
MSAMPTTTLSRDTLKALSISPDDFTYHLSPEEKRRLEALLVSRAFDLTAAIGVVVLASGEGVVLTQ